MSRRDGPSLGGRASRAALLGGALAVWLVGARDARAETIDATSTTLLSGRRDPRDGVVHTAVPVYELVSVRATELRLPGVEDMTVVMSGWGAAALADPLEDKRLLGDLDVAFAEGKLLHRRLAVRLGRQLLMEGAGRNWAFDGLAVTARPWRWAGLSAQAGVPVTPRFAVERGDALVAARAFVKPTFDGEAGVSFLQVLDNGELARRDLALDARVVPVASVPLALSGFALWSLPERRLGEGHVTTTWQMGRRLEVSGEYRRTAPDLFLPRNSIFSVFSQETHDEAGGFLYLRLLPRLRLQGNTHVIVDADGTGYDADAKLSGTFGPEGRSTAGLESRRLALPHTGYTLARAFALVPVASRVVTTLDASAFFFDADVNGERRSYVGAATVAYAFRPGWRALVSGIGSVTPFAERRFEGMAKLVYQASVQTRHAAGKATP
jgi:hypothetical protein